MCFDMMREVAQRRENPLVLDVLGTYLETIPLGYGERDFEHVDGIEAERFAVQRCGGIEFVGGNRQSQRSDDQRCEFALQRSDRVRAQALESSVRIAKTANATATILRTMATSCGSSCGNDVQDAAHYTGSMALDGDDGRCRHGAAPEGDSARRLGGRELPVNEPAYRQQLRTIERSG